MLCDGPVPTAVDNTILFITACCLLLCSIVTFSLFKFLPLSKTLLYKYFQVRWMVQIVAVHIGCILIGLVTLDIPACQVNALAILSPALLILPPAIRVFNYRQQSLLTLTAAHEAETAKDALISPRGSMLSFISVPRLTIAVRMIRAICNGQVRRSDIDVETIRQLRNLGRGNLAIQVLVGCIVPFLITFIVLVCEEARPEAVRGVLVVAYAVCLVPLILALVRTWYMPDPFFVVRETRWSTVLFLPATLVLVFMDRGEAMIPALLFCLSQTWFTPAFVFVLHVWTRTQRKKWIKQQPVFETSTEEFDNCLMDAKLHEAFFQHLTAEHSVDSLIFYDEVSKWSKEYHDMGTRTAYIRARKIVQCYVGDEAIFPVNLPGDLIVKLRSGVDPTFEAKKKPSYQQKSFRFAAKKTSDQSTGAGAGAMATNTIGGLDSATAESPSSPVQLSKLSRAMSSLRVRFTSYAEDSHNTALPGGAIEAIEDYDDEDDTDLEKQASSRAVVADATPATTTDASASTSNVYLVNSSFFDQAEAEIKFLMRMDGFDRFKRTKQYHEALMECEEAKRRNNAAKLQQQEGSGLFGMIKRSKE